MADDVLKGLPVKQVAEWYGRLAEAWAKNAPGLQPALAAEFLKAWLNNRTPTATIAFDAPSHLRKSNVVFETQSYHRDVFLSVKKARLGRKSASVEKWAGLLPRIQGVPGYPKWDMTTPLGLEYESICDIAPNQLAIGVIQQVGSAADLDILGSLHGFQLKSEVTVGPLTGTGNSRNVAFQSWTCSGTDRYDWDPSKYMTVFNPDYGSTEADAIEPKSEQLTVFHSNARRVEDAKLASPYNVFLRPWPVTDARICGPAVIDISRKL